MSDTTTGDDMTCKTDGCERTVLAKGLCNACYQRQWKLANPGRAQALAREAIARSPEHYAALNRFHDAKTRVRRAGTGAVVAWVTPDQFADRLAEYCGNCAYCVNPATGWDHVTPLARGGSHTIGNLVPACGPCNKRKAQRTLLEFVGA